MSSLKHPISSEDQALIDLIRRKIEREEVTLMQEKFGDNVSLYPPTPLDEIERAEAALSAPLPPLMREIWLQVGNGGFGPGYGITGVYTGERIYKRTLVEMVLGRHEILDHLRDDLIYVSENLEGKERAEAIARTLQWIQDWSALDRLAIEYAYWGCQVLTVVDCSKPELPVYWVDGFNIGPHSSNTLRQWWRDWLAGTINQY